MLFLSSFAIITLALGTAAEWPMIREAAPIVKVINSVMDLTAELDQTVKIFGGDAQPFKDASTKLLAGINDGIKSMQASASLSLEASGQIGIPTMDLNATVATTVAHLISKKQALIQTGQGAIVYQSLLDQIRAADTFAKTINSKVDKAVEEMVATLSSGIVISLQEGINAFKDVSTAPVPTTPEFIVLPTQAPTMPAPTTPLVIFDPITSASLITSSSAGTSKSHSKSTGGDYDTPVAPSKTSSHGYDIVTPSSSSKPSSKSAPGYGYDSPSAPVSKPTKSAPGYGYDIPSSPAAPKPTGTVPGYGYGAPPPAYDAPAGPSKTKTWAPAPVSTTKVAPPAVFTAGGAFHGMSGGLAVLAGVVMVL